MSYHIIDVRSESEFSEGHAKDAINIPVEQIDSNHTHLEAIPKSDTIIVYCRSGARANMAQQILHKLGYQQTINALNETGVEKAIASLTD
ncbi:rhodanese-like domain-containing protein [Candidatus Saccharibacteria bacterium]|nr:rhodanese-like domain-containing protein [Candidatus Saccharibacteria bacterium]